MSDKMIVWDDSSIITITPVVKNSGGTPVSQGQPIEVPLSALVAYLQTKTGWTA